MSLLDAERRLLGESSGRGLAVLKHSTNRRPGRGSVDDSIESGCDQNNEGLSVTPGSRQKSRRLLTDPSRLPSSPISSALPKTSVGHSNHRNRHSKRVASGTGGETRHHHRRLVGARSSAMSRGSERDVHPRYHRHFPRDDYNRPHRPPLNRRIVAAAAASTAAVKHGDSAAESSSESEDDSRDVDAVSPSHSALPSASLADKARHRSKRMQSLVGTAASASNTIRQHGRQHREHSTSFSRAGRIRLGFVAFN